MASLAFAARACRSRRCSINLEIDGGLTQFATGFPNVSRETAVAVIGLASRGLLEGLRNL